MRLCAARSTQPARDVPGPVPRQEYWRKGDTSGHVQYVKGVSLDCDGDALLVEVDQVGAACHTGKRSCFLEGGPSARGRRSSSGRAVELVPFSGSPL